jgi:CubicO group peptidase (beta-lactamase class C family)
MIRFGWIFQLVCCIYLHIPIWLSGQQSSGIPGNIPSAQLDSIAWYIDVFPDNTQLSISLMNDSSVSYLGFVKTDGKWRAVENRDSVFEIGSITKVFTSTVLVKLYANDLLDLDDPISGMLPFDLNQAELDGRQITLKTLANHTSGLPRIPENLMPLVSRNPGNPYRDYDNALLIEYLEKKMEFQSAPGTAYRYSNLGAGILGYILELKSGKSYEELLLERVFSVYQMSSSTTLRRNISSKLVQGRNSHGKAVPNWDLNALRGAGAILSTTRDLSRFVRANFGNDEVLSMQRETTFIVNSNLDLGLGWHILKTENGDRWHWHNGGTGGYRSQLVMDIMHRKAAIILSNVSASNPDSGNIDQLGFALLKTLRLYDAD